MTPTEVLREIQKFPLSDAWQVAHQLTHYLREKEQSNATDEDMERRDDEFERYLFVSHIATRDETDEEFDAFEMIEVAGEPLSATIIRERR